MPVIQITMSEGRTIEQKRELVKVLTKETARILNSKEENMRILIYEVSKENWGNAGILGTDMKNNSKKEIMKEDNNKISQ
jgi:4-oxalocrotonate tautomerase